MWRVSSPLGEDGIKGRRERRDLSGISDTHSAVSP